MLANWSGDIPDGTVWSNSEVQRVTGNVQIPAGAKLTIQAGTTIKFDGNTAMTVDGTLTAQGTAPNPIIFTSFRDGPTTAGPGDWQSITFTNTSTGSVLDHVEVRYAGGSFSSPAIVDNGAPLTLTNSLIRDTNQAGLRITGASPTITGDTFQNNRFAAISLDLAAQPVISGATFTSNGVNGAALDGGSLPGNESWNNPGVVYWLNDTVTVPTGKTLTIAPGQVIKFDPSTGATLTVNGTLKAQGTTAQPVIFTSSKDDSAGGDTNNDGASAGERGSWQSITFTSTSVGSVLDHVDVRYAGRGFTTSAIMDNGAPLTLTNSVVRETNQSGLRIAGANPTVTNVSFVHNRFSAISMDLASQPVFTGVTFTNNDDGVNGLTVDGGILPANKSWNNPGVVYWLNDTVTVPAGKTLTIVPGQVIKFAPSTGATLTVNGTLNAQGTTAQPVIFTSFRDDSAGGDTNNDGSTAGERGDWQSITFTSTSVGSVLDHVDVRYAGRGFTTSAIMDNGAPLTLTNSVVRETNQSGLRIAGANPTVTNVSFVHNRFSAISMDLASQPVFTGITFTNNDDGVNGLTLDGGTLPANKSWNNPGVVYWLNDTVTVPVGKTLTIAPGQVIKFSPTAGASLIVDGTLKAQGTTAQPVIFTSFRDDSAGGHTNNDGGTAGERGDWQSITFTSTSVGSVLDHVEVRYAGGGFTTPAVVDNGAPLTLTNSVIRDTNQSGLRITGANPTIKGNTFVNNRFAAISLDLAAQPVITGATFTNNGIVNGVALDGGTLATSVSWNNPQVVYWLSETITVAAGATLTIAPGQAIKFAPSTGAALTVKGTLKAQGTLAQPVIFTSFRDDTAGGDTNNDGTTEIGRGDWQSITFASTSVGSVLDHVEVRYAGGSFTTPAIVDNGAPLTLTNSLIRDTNQVGLRITGANPTVTNVSFVNDRFAAISMDHLAKPVFHGVSFTGNGANGVELDGGTLPGNELWNNPEIVYWISDTIVVPVGNTLTVAPGQVVKFSPSGGARITVNGTLKAQGTVAQPVIFTSYRDDTAGGDTNNDGTTEIGRGDWFGIEFTSTSTGNVLDHVDLRSGFGAGADQQGTIEVNGGSLTMTNSVMRNMLHDALVAGTNSTVILSNNLLLTSRRGILALAGSHVTAVNNTIDGHYLTGVEVDAANVVLTNNLITNSVAGLTVTGSPTLTFNFNDVFNPNGSNYVGIANQTGTHGNLSAAPKYFNRDNSQYQLRAGSPAEDAGTSAGAPATDSLGKPRFKDPNVPGRGDGSGYDMGAFERQEAATSDIDLATTVVSGPATGLEGQTVTLNWTVQNVGTGLASGSWHDAIYLSTTPVLTPDAVFLGDALHTGDLGPGQTYNGSTSVTLPGVLPGNSYFIVRSNSRNEVFEATAVANNVLASANPVAMDLPVLTLGTPVNGALAKAASVQLYKVSVPAGAALDVELTGASGAINELYVGAGDIPTRQSFLARSTRPDTPNQSISLANAQAGTYYILVYGAKIPSPESFTLTARAAGFGVRSVEPSKGSNTGQVTVSFLGSQFDSKSSPQLVDSAGHTINPLKTYVTDTGLIEATFDLTGRPAGPADVRVVNTGNVVSTLPHGFTIIAGQGGRLVTSLSGPSGVRLGRSFIVTVQLANVGDTDLLAPVLSLSSGGLSTLSFTPGAGHAGTSVSLVGSNDKGPAGILPPGARRDITVYGIAGASGTETFTLGVATYPSGPIDYSAIGPAIRPPALSDTEWNALFAQLQTQIGPDWGSYALHVSQDATLLPAGAGLNFSLADVLGLEVDRARAALSTSVSGQLRLGDATHPLGNVRVTLTNPANDTGAETVSLNDGSFVLPDIAPGTYNVTLEGYVTASLVQVTVGTQSVSGLSVVAQPAASITGSVVVGAGIPLGNVSVHAFNANGQVFSTLTDDDGLYQIDSLPAGVYTVDAGGGTVTHVAIPLAALGAGEQRAHVDFVLAAAAKIKGSVKGPSGPIAGATVSALGANGEGESTTTAADGTFTLDGLSAQAYTVSAFAAGLASAEQSGVTPAAGATTTGVNLVLKAGGSITGSVDLAADGSPAAFFLLAITKGSDTYTAQTDSQGNFNAPDLPPGTYTVAVESSDFMTTTATVSVSTGAATTLNLKLSALATVTGKVLNSLNNKPVSGVTVYAADPSGNLLASAVTQADGTYQIAGLDSGTDTIVLGDPGTSGAARSQVTLSPTKLAAVANFNVSVAGVIRGKVFSAGTTPDTSATVTLSQNGAAILTKTVDPSGDYSFVVLKAGTYQVEAGDVGLTFPPITVAVSGGADFVGRNFVGGSFAVTGVVKDGQGHPVAGASVFVRNLGTGLVVTDVGTVIAGADGSFSLTGLINSSYRVTVHANGLAMAAQTFNIAGANPVALALTMGQESTLQGTIRDGITAAGLSGASISLRSLTSPGIAGGVTTDSSGGYQIAGIPAGDYSLTVLAGGHQAITRTVTLAGVTTVQDLSLAIPTIHVQGKVTVGAVPVAGALVLAIDASGAVLGEAVTPLDGTYDLATLAAGTYSILVSADGFAPAAALSLTVTDGQTRTGNNFALQVAAVSDPPASTQSVPAILSGTPESALGFLDSLLRTATPLSRQPKLDDLNGKIDMENCPDESKKAISLVSQVPGLFQDWQQAQSELRWSAGREFVSIGLQVANTAGKFLLAVRSAAASVALNAASAAQKVFLNFVAPLATDISNIVVAKVFQYDQRSFQDNLPDAVSNLNEARSKYLTLKDKLLEAQRLAKQEEVDLSVLKSGATEVAEIKRLQDKIAKASKFLASLDAVLTLVSTLGESLDAYRSLVGQFQTLINAKEKYSSAVAEANASIYFLDLCRGDHPGQPLPVLPPGTIPTARTSIRFAQAFDPNDLIGPAGFGPQGFIQPGLLSFEVEFENDPKLASAAAQVVTVTTTLDASMDLSTLQFTGFGFGSHTFSVPAGLSHYQTTIDLRPDGVSLLVPVTLDVNLQTRVLTATFQSLDPGTGQPPDGLDDGFLPIDNAAHDGEGFFTYTVRPKAALATGTAIHNVASIVFDSNGSISTPTTLNTIDAGGPTSSVTPLPATTSTTSFTVSWSGTDDGNGSGIAYYNIFVSDNGGAFTPFRAHTTATSAVFTGQPGHSYGFYSVAADNVGNIQATPSAAQTTTTISVTPGTPAAPVLSTQSDTGTSTSDGLTNHNGSATATLVFNVSETPAQNDFFRLFDVTNPSQPLLLAGPLQAVGGTITVSTQALADGVHKIAATTAATVSGGQSALSPSTSITVQTSLKVTKVTPADKSFFASALPGGQIVVTFSHPLANLTADVASGGGFAKNPFAVYLVPRGPGAVFAAPSGLDLGSTPLHATLVYHVNANGTSTITLTPREPLATDVYLIAVTGGLTDLAGNRVLNNSGQPGTYFATFELRPIPATKGAPKVLSVTTQRASVAITNNSVIPQPDTIAIAFNMPLNFLTVTNKTVQLLAGTSQTPVSAAVFYSPTTNTIYLTPQAILVPGTKYTVRVVGTGKPATSVTGDQGFPNPGFPMGTSYTTTFQVKNAAVGAGHSPFTVVKDAAGKLAISPGPGVRGSLFGYGSISFSERLDMSSLGRYSVMLSLQAGGLNNTAFDAADAALNAKLAFNPNTNTLIIVPTVALGNGNYLFTLTKVKAVNGDLLTNPGGTMPIYSSFTVKTNPPKSAQAVTSGLASLAAVSSPVVKSVATSVAAPPTAGATSSRSRPAQAIGSSTTTTFLNGLSRVTSRRVPLTGEKSGPAGPLGLITH